MQRFFLIYLFIFAIPEWGIGQTARFFASTDASEILVGSYVDVSFTLENADGSDFQPPSFKEFKVLSGPNRSSSMSIVNGRVSKKLSYSYSLQPRSTGTFEIASASIRTSSGEVLHTNPLTVNVQQGESKVTANSNEDVFIQTILSDSTAFVGQQITLSYKLYTKLDVRSVNFASDPELEGFFIKELSVSGERTKREIINGQEYATKVIKRLSLFPQQKGYYKIDPVAVNLGIASGRRSNSFFFNAMLDPKRVIADGVNIDVSDTPPTNKKSFSGAIGKYEMELSLDKRTVTTDDAIRVLMRVIGNGDNKTVLAPQWVQSDSFDIYDPNILEDETFQRPGEVMHRKTFEYLLVPKITGKFQLTPEFTYYDTDSSGYISLRQNLPTINVIPGTNADSFISNPSQLTQLEPVRNSKLHLSNRNRHKSLPYLLGIVTFLIGITTLFYVSYRNKKKQEENPFEKIRQQASKVALEKLEKLNSLKNTGHTRAFYEELTRSVKQYVTDKYQIPAFHKGNQEILTQLKTFNLQPEHLEKFSQLLQKSETALYAPGSNVDLEIVYNEALELLTQLES